MNSTSGTLSVPRLNNRLSASEYGPFVSVQMSTFMLNCISEAVSVYHLAGKAASANSPPVLHPA